MMLFQTVTLIYFESLFKMVYTDSRPVFVNEDIREFSCNCDYGKPSGHAMISVALPLLIISDLNSHFRISRHLKVIVIILYFIGVAIISFSKIYLGDNSINQVSFVSFSIGCFRH
jgi:membrane-associated phospholipid phosphatase